MLSSNTFEIERSLPPLLILIQNLNNINTIGRERYRQQLCYKEEEWKMILTRHDF